MVPPPAWASISVARRRWLALCWLAEHVKQLSSDWTLLVDAFPGLRRAFDMSAGRSIRGGRTRQWRPRRGGLEYRCRSCNVRLRSLSWCIDWGFNTGTCTMAATRCLLYSLDLSKCTFFDWYVFAERERAQQLFESPVLHEGHANRGCLTGESIVQCP